jgi:hypothetical protein
MQLPNIGDRLAAIELTEATSEELGAFIKAETERCDQEPRAEGK